MWTRLIALPRFDLAVTCPLSIVFSFYWIYGLGMLFVDLTHSPAFIYRTKLQKRPFQVEGGLYNPPLRKLLWRSVTGQLSTWLLVAAVRATGIQPEPFEITPDPPSAVRVLIEVTLMFSSEAVLFYFMHRLLHTPFLYRNVHRVHHEFKTPIALASTYAHPVETIMGNAFPVAFGPVLPWLLGLDTRVHLFSVYVFAVMGMRATMRGHSGYGTYHLPFDPRARQPLFHDAHHRQIKGNFGNHGLLDFIFKTKLD